MARKTKTTTEYIHHLRDVNKLHRASFSRLDLLAIWVTNHVGTMGFFLILLAWTIFWLGWNVFGPSHMRFDPFPAFVLWLFISNMIQILLMPLIMVGQNLQNRHAELRAQSEYEINLRLSKEIKEILRLLNEIRRQLKWR